MNQSIKQQLLLMGFEDWLIEEAMSNNKGQGVVRVIFLFNFKETVLNWITQHSTLSPVKGSSSNSDVSEASVKQLTAMGFDADLAKSALKNSVPNISPQLKIF